MGCTWMTVVGGVLEIIGFALIVGQFVRVQRQEFGTPRFILRSRSWIEARVRRLFGRSKVVNLRAGMTAAVRATC